MGQARAAIAAKCMENEELERKGKMATKRGL